MQKSKKYDWKDSNMALFGSDTEKTVKKEAAESEPAWSKCGTEVGLKIWRINKFKVEEWPREQYGEFYTGDSYIVLNTFKEGDSDSLQYDVHFWIGKHSTQDEYGTAAYKTVELDTYLDDKPIQHREVQGHESSTFRSYFDTLTLLKGGCDTGFNRVAPEEYKIRLLHVRRSGRVLTVTEVSAKKGNLKDEDVFIVDQGLQIYQINGSKCSHDEKFKAAQEVQKIAGTRKRSRVEVVEASRMLSCHPAIICLTDGKSKKEDPIEGEKKMMKNLGSNDVQMTELDGYGADELKSEDVFVINTGSHVFTWVGRNASSSERKNALPYACNYLNKTKTPWLPISVIGEGNESQAFIQAIRA